VQGGLQVTDLVDSIFGPLLTWLTDIYNRISQMSVPLAHPLNLSNYFGVFNVLGPDWTTVITSILALSFIYFLVWIIMNNLGLIVKFKNLIKWW
jgi:hypothetical protein